VIQSGTELRSERRRQATSALPPGPGAEELGEFGGAVKGPYELPLGERGDDLDLMIIDDFTVLGAPRHYIRDVPGPNGRVQGADTTMADYRVGGSNSGAELATANPLDIGKVA
jgi:hypothetical protein